jgi:transcriptional regulator with XRE-family HTH domain
MTQYSVPDRLQDVLDAYMASTSKPDIAALAEWIRRFPEYEQELTAFTVSWSLTETLPPAQAVQDTTSEDLLHRGRAIVGSILSEGSASTIAASMPPSARETTTDHGSAVAPIAGLVAEARARGLSANEVAEAAGLSLVLLRLLDRRLIRFASIPREVIDALAQALGREAAVVGQYLQGTATLAQGTSYYAVRPPALAQQQDFFDAVRGDPDLSEDERARWLALEPPGA